MVAVVLMLGRVDGADFLLEETLTVVDIGAVEEATPHTSL